MYVEHFHFRVILVSIIRHNFELSLSACMDKGSCSLKVDEEFCSETLSFNKLMFIKNYVSKRTGRSIIVDLIHEIVAS